MSKIHYHTECEFFAGCENMLANFFNSKSFREVHEISFSYVSTKLYEDGLKRRVHLDLPVYPLNFHSFPDLKRMSQWIPPFFSKMFFSIFRLIFNAALFSYQIYILFCLFKKIKPDILHINNGGYPAALSARAAAVAAKYSGVPNVVMVINNMAVGYWSYSRWLDYPIDRVVARCVDTFITGSHAAGNRLQDVLKLSDTQIKTIHNGIELRDFTCTTDETKQRFGLHEFKGVIFGVVALLVPRKGHQILLDAILMMVADKKFSGKEFKILIEGSGPLKQKLFDFVDKNHLSPWVEFIGDEDSIIDFMAALDVLILPSVRDEDFPNVILEAMALGKPVIASRLTGLMEQVVDGVTGLLFAPGDATQLAANIYQLLGSSETRVSMGDEAKKRFVGNFTSSIALDNYNEAYAKLTEDHQCQI